MHNTKTFQLDIFPILFFFMIQNEQFPEIYSNFMVYN